jgi:hypothetical protein
VPFAHERCDLLRKLPSDLALLALLDRREASGQLLLDGVVGRLEPSTQLGRQIIHQLPRTTLAPATS